MATTRFHEVQSMSKMFTRIIRTAVHPLAWLLPVCQMLIAPAFAAGCPSGEVELLPNLRALPPRDIAMLDANNIKFSTTSWNPGDGRLTLVARTPETDPASGQLKQPVDQRISCSGGGYYDRPAGSAEYHEAHNHVHYNDYANYILESISSAQNPRKGSKTTFCIMDTSSVNTQIAGSSGSAVFNWCPTQDPSFNTQGMSVGWGDTYGSHLAGQSISVDGLADGMYRLRNIFDPNSRLLETQEADNESCRHIELGSGSNGRYVADRGPCEPPAAGSINSVTPTQAAHGSCVSMTIFGANFVPEQRLSFAGGTGPLPSAQDLRLDPAGNYIEATVCVPRAKGGKRNPRFGSDPVWDVSLSGSYGGYAPVTKANVFRVTP